MKNLMKAKQGGLRSSLAHFYRKIADYDLREVTMREFIALVAAAMKKLDFDMVRRDKAGNLIGIMKGYEARENLAMVSHVDFAHEESSRAMPPALPADFKNGVLTALYTAALIKRSALARRGDLIVCCVPRSECCDFGIRYLFENFLKDYASTLKGVVLCEPTGFNINLGHKGRFEYEIVVKGRMGQDALAARGVNILGTMFPLINELEKVSRQLPRDCELGASSLKIKDVKYNGCNPQEDFKEFKIVVDRVFVPEEDPKAILRRAKTIGKDVYRHEPQVEVNSACAKTKIKTYAGVELVSRKALQPWKMESHQPFALQALEALNEAGIKSAFGYWQHVMTEGSYTYGELKIPTIGFGAGVETASNVVTTPVDIADIEKAVYASALIVQRNIGIPTFGWSADEI